MVTIFKTGDYIKILEGVGLIWHNFNKKKVYRIVEMYRCPERPAYCSNPVSCPTERWRIKVCHDSHYDPLSVCGYKIVKYNNKKVSKNYICYDCKDRLFCTIGTTGKAIK